MIAEYVIKGGPVMYPLLACSVLAWAVVTERFLFWMRVRHASKTRGPEVCLRLLRDQACDEAAELTRTSSDPIVRILHRGITERHASPVLAMETQAKVELSLMRRYSGLLETLITLAPLLGIYGTITGIIRAFGFLSAAGLPDPKLVANGIAEALITTAAGLTIAITTIPAYQYFINQADRMAEEIERHATTLETLLCHCEPHTQLAGCGTKHDR